MLKNTLIELRYHAKQYMTWLLINLGVIFLTFLLLNLTSSLPIDKATRVFQLSGYLVFFWMAGAMYFSSSILSTRGFILSITNFPVYVLVNIQIINFFLTFLLSFLMLMAVKTANGIHLDISLLGMFYFFAAAYLLLIPVCTLLSLCERYVKDMRKVIFGILVLIFLTVPILWIPSNVPEVLLNILKLSPFFFVVNGFQESVVLGSAAFYNYPNHLLFIFELILIYLWSGYLFRMLKDEININKQ